MKKIQNFLADWGVDALGTKPMFQAMVDELSKLEKVEFEWVHRPGVSYSLRASYVYRKKARLFVMVDVIDDHPEQRWLSVCFHQEMISDPENRGDVVAGGLLGDDGYCFDIDEPDLHVKAYVLSRMEEAYKKVRGEK